MLFGDKIRNAKILIVDDNLTDIMIASELLSKGGYCDIHSTADPTKAKALYQRLDPDILLLDIHMPKLSGFNIMTQLIQDYPNQYLPILILTADHRDDIGTIALGSGAQDFVTKPFNSTELLLRVGNIAEIHMLHRELQNQNLLLEAKVQHRTEEIHQSRVKLIACLARAAEYKDNETGMHVTRISESSRIIAKRMGLSKKWIDIIALASPMHDVGKIGIPDKVLLKPGKLVGEEWEIMKSHAELGAKILDFSDSELLNAAASIAKTHHERWDGQGYPDGLAGNEIPLLTRIVSVCDVFDALTSQRPYKEAWSAKRSLAYLRDNAGKQFDPLVVDEFVQALPQVLELRTLNPDPPDSSAPH
ncbi:MAG: response regulator [Pseudomonadales bacterium]|nr:response regulator [Pseudomonadales bacterium]